MRIERQERRSQTVDIAAMLCRDKKVLLQAQSPARPLIFARVTTYLVGFVSPADRSALATSRIVRDSPDALLRTACA